MILSTDSTANLPKEMYGELNIKMIPMQIYLEGNIYDDLSPELTNQFFYGKMRDGAVPKTAQINQQDATTYFEKLLSSGEDVLHISFSTALSGNTQTMMNVAEELNKTHKNKVVVFNSLNASIGEGMLVIKAYDLIKQNKTMEEIISELEKFRNHSCAFFTVEQLKYLVRGGRVGKVSGFIGSVLKIKPILHVDAEGRLVAFKKVMGRKKSIAELANICAEKITDKNRIYVSYAECLEEAQELANQIKEKVGVMPTITPLTQVIACHTGPGLLAVFFEGNEK